MEGLGAIFDEADANAKITADAWSSLLLHVKEQA
jgi:hypothetical protein